MKFKKKVIAIAVAGMAGTTQLALAADTPVLEEVIVTAQKVSENLQKIPVAVTAMTSETLQQMGISNLADLGQVKIPSVNMMPFAGRKELMQITMRGITTADPGQGTTDSGVAIVVDDVYNARGFGVGLNAAEIERIEVLRGPQGTLFGRNAVGGAIRMVTKGPSGEFGGNVKLGVTNYSGTSAEAHLNTQEVNGLSFKFDLKETKHDGFTKNPSSRSALTNHHDFGELDAQSGKFSAQLKATDNLKLNYSYDDGTYKTTTTYAQHDAPPAVCQGGVPCGPGSAFFAIPPTSPGGLPDTAWIGMYAGPSVTKYTNHRLGVEWQLQDNLTLKSITSHTKAELAIHEGTLNGAYSFTSFGGFNIAQIGRRTPAAFGTKGIAAGGLTGPNQIFGLSGVIPWATVNSTTSSQEFQLIGNTDTVKWIAGAYWFKEESRDIRTTAFSLAYTGFAGGRPINPVATDPFYLTTNAGPDDTSKTDTQSKVDAYAVFMQGTWTPASMQQLHITGGLRYSHDHRTFHRSIDAGLPVNYNQPTFQLSRVDPLISVAYDVNDTTNAYVRYGSAYRAGGASVRSPWNPTNPLSKFAVYRQEVDKTLEGGIKTDLMDRRLRLNAAIYQTWSKDPIQSVQFDPAQPSITGTINIPGTQKLKGIELEAVFAATERLTLSGNLAWQSFKYAPDVQAYIDKFDPGAAYSPTPFPKYAGGIAADYSMPVAIGQVVFHADWNKSSKGPGTGRAGKGNYLNKIWTDVLNARVTWQGIKVGNNSLKVSGFVTNLNNTHTPVFTAASGQWVTSEPRMVGLEVGLDF